MMLGGICRTRCFSPTRSVASVSQLVTLNYDTALCENQRRQNHNGDSPKKTQTTKKSSWKTPFQDLQGALTSKKSQQQLKSTFGATVVNLEVGGYAKMLPDAVTGMFAKKTSNGLKKECNKTDKEKAQCALISSSKPKEGELQTHQLTAEQDDDDQSGYLNQMLTGSSSSIQDPSQTHMYMLTRKDAKQQKIEPQSSSSWAWTAGVFDLLRSKDADSAAKLKREKKRKTMLEMVPKADITREMIARVNSVQKATSRSSMSTRLDALVKHLVEFPQAAGVAQQADAIPILLRARSKLHLKLDQDIQGKIRQALALVGYADPVKTSGIRILAIDGGGTRGLVAIEILKKIEKITGQRVHELFDIIIGVSTGGLLASLLGCKRFSLDKCEMLYKKSATAMFTQNWAMGFVGLGRRASYFDPDFWEKILREEMGEGTIISSAADRETVKIGIITALSTPGLRLKNHLFRNYNHRYGTYSTLEGTCKHKLWQAIRATTAAPFIYEPYILDGKIHRDGGILTNNPTRLAIDEAQCIWPDEDIQCIVSLGTGRYEPVLFPERDPNESANKIPDIFNKIIDSASDTEGLHQGLMAMLPGDKYYRLNPYLSCDIKLSDNCPQLMTLMQDVANQYLENNDWKVQKLAKQLTSHPRTVTQKARDHYKLHRDSQFR